ncbi:unnamed protein product [Dibothriocephalus latus]|uniref:Uncharacterized protein n=1 Tax=Dibothriocephalus latus TaxID=60516 RepID=A0A3P6VBQ7_DIBLA|nr:unnamed protein product [Dibothriocephalus latus]
MLTSTPSLAVMSTPQAQLFEDELPLIRSCPALNEIRSAEQLEDLTIEVRSIFVIGGHTPQQAGSTAVDEFIVRERCWCQRPSLANRRLVAASAVVKVNDEHREGEQKALIGVFGGSYKAGASWSYLAACEVFDVKQNK